MPQHPPLGFTFAGVAAGIKKTGAADLALIVSDRPCAAAAVFTQNKFPAAPVLYDRALVAENSGGLRGAMINAGCANACTGDDGLADAAQMAAAAEAAAGLPPHSCAVMSTGVIGVRLPMDKIVTGARLAAAALAADGWEAAARAIITTDTRPKVAFRETAGIRLFGMCKGAGMIHPNMATMLATIVTDAAIAPAALDAALRRAVEVSFNSISVDGDTSTNDTVLVLANGAAGPTDADAFADALTSLCTDLAQQIVRDGEGATKFITVRVEGASSDADARRAAKAIANSPLVKTAFYGGDANWGRILCAVGYSGAEVDPARADLWIAAGTGLAPIQDNRRGDPLWSPRGAGVHGDRGAGDHGAGDHGAHGVHGAGDHGAGVHGDHGAGDHGAGVHGAGDHGVHRAGTHDAGDHGDRGAGVHGAGDRDAGIHAVGDHGGSPLQLVAHGQPCAYPETTASAIFAGKEIAVTVNLGLGAGQATVWTCDLSHDYVSINGHYRT